MSKLLSGQRGDLESLSGGRGSNLGALAGRPSWRCDVFARDHGGVIGHPAFFAEARELGDRFCVGLDGAFGGIFSPKMTNEQVCIEPITIGRNAGSRESRWTRGGLLC